MDKPQQSGLGLQGLSKAATVAVVLQQLLLGEIAAAVPQFEKLAGDLRTAQTVTGGGEAEILQAQRKGTGLLGHGVAPKGIEKERS
jgi:hypothetical protein